MSKYNEKNNSPLLVGKVRRYITKLRDMVTNRHGMDQVELMLAAYSSLKDFFLRLRKPVSHGLELRPDDPRDAGQFNSHMEDVEADINILFDQSVEAARMIADTTNYTTALSRNLKGRVERMRSTLTNIRLVNNQSAKSTFVAGDDFADDSLIDPNFPVVGTRMRFDHAAKAAMLTPTSAQNVSPEADIISVSGPTRGDFVRTTGLYEGKYYEVRGDAAWEGDGVQPDWIAYVAVPTKSDGPLAEKARALKKKWDAFLSSGTDQAEEIKAALDNDTATQKIQELRATGEFRRGKLYGEGFGFTLDEVELFALNYHEQWGSEYLVIPAEGVGRDSDWPDETFTFYKPAQTPYDALVRGRDKALDDSPGTVLRLENNWLTDPWFGKSAENQDGSLRDPGDMERQLRSLIGTEQMNEILKSAGGKDPGPLEVTLVVDLKEKRQVNWINLLPLVESEGSWLEVLSIEYGLEDRDGAYRLIPNFFNDRYDNVLTDEANKEVTDAEAGVTMAGSKSTFAGTGLWVFESVLARYLRIRIRQSAPSPVLYSRVRTHLTGTITTTIRKTKKSFFFFRSVDTKKEYDEKQQLRLLDYEQSVVWSNTNSEELRLGIVGTTTVTPKPKSEKNRPDFVAMGALSVIPIVGTLVGVFGFGTKIQKSQKWSGWSVKDWWWEPQFDRARYAIGIRDLNVFSYRYSREASFASTLYRVPRPINKVVLHTHQIIPQQLLDEDGAEDWIRYEVSFDDQTWHQIAPVSSAAVDNKRQIIPQILNINSDIPEDLQNPRESYLSVPGSVQQVRLRVSFKRADDDRISPVLKSYRLMIETTQG